MTVAQKIDNILKSKGMSRRQLAIKAKFAPSSLQSAMERGDGFSIKMLEKIASTLNVPFSTFISEKALEDNTEPDRVKLRHALGAHHGKREDIAYQQLLRLSGEEQQAICRIIDRLGHENVETTLNTYSHLWPHKQEEVADKLQALEAAPAGSKTVLKKPEKENKPFNVDKKPTESGN